MRERESEVGMKVNMRFWRVKGYQNYCMHEVGGILKGKCELDGEMEG